MGKGSNQISGDEGKEKGERGKWAGVNKTGEENRKGKGTGWRRGKAYGSSRRFKFAKFKPRALYINQVVMLLLLTRQGYRAST